MSRATRGALPALGALAALGALCICPQGGGATVLAAGAASVPEAAAAGAATGASVPAAPDPYQKEIGDWRAERVAGLKREGGWLTLVGLFWLEEGENRFGSDPGNRVILPAGKAPAVAGSLVRHGEQVTLQAAPGLQPPLSVEGGDKPVAAPLVLASDVEGKPTVLRLGSLSFYLIKRGDRLGVRVKDREAPALAGFKGLDNFPVKPDWRVVARFEPYQPLRQIPIANVLGMTEPTPSPGAVVFERDGKTYRLDALQESPDGKLFLIFADQTNGKETYGAGRFLNTDEPPKAGRVVVDFNKAYNPPCAFSAFATCPLPPPQNRLALRIEAGEKNFGEGHH